MRGNLIGDTGQSWKLWLTFLLIIGGSVTSYVVKMRHGPVLLLALIAIPFGGFAFGALAIRCPSCGAKLFWLAVSKHSLGEWQGWLLRLRQCPECGYREEAPEPADDFFNAPLSARADNPPPRRERGHRPLICPGCSGRMKELEAGTVLVDRCPSCGGLWFDRDEIEGYVRSMDSDLPGHVPDDSDTLGLTDISTQDCPRCRTSKMQLGLFKGLSFEKCTSCGGYFLSQEQVKAVVETARRDSSGFPSPVDAAANVVSQGVTEYVIRFVVHFIVGMVGPK